MADTTLELARRSRLWIEGDSTLHRYRAEAGQLNASFSVDAPGDVETLIRSGHVKAFALSVPVAQLHSGKSDLDETIVKTLRGREHPLITFRMDSYAASPAADGEPFVITLRGSLLIAGARRDIELNVNATPSGSGFHLTGRKQLLMSDFGVKPPTLMMGVLKTRDEVLVSFDVLLER